MASGLPRYLHRYDVDTSCQASNRQAQRIVSTCIGNEAQHALALSIGDSYLYTSLPSLSEVH